MILNAMKSSHSLLFAICIACYQMPALADDTPENSFAPVEGNWGIALIFRSAEIPYNIPGTQVDDERVSDLIPVIYYENDYFFWRGLQAGFKLKTNEQWEFNLLGRYRFFDIPDDLQNEQNTNEPRGNRLDIGLQYRYKFSKELNADFELMDDTNGRSYINTIANFHWHSGSWDLSPYAQLRWKSSEFNNRYYGLEGLVDPANSASPGSAFDLTVGSTVRYHVVDNLYVLGRLSLTRFDKDTYQASTVSSPTQNEIYIGFGYFDDMKKKKPRTLKSRQYLRIAHGWATPSNIGDIFKFDIESDEFNNQLTSVFYGLPVADSLFGVPFSIYFTPGLIAHHQSEVQPRFAEYVLAIKGYYTVKWPTTWRPGIATGLSYTSKISFIEQEEMDEKGFRPSKLMNYWDFSVDIELGDLFNSKSLHNWWAGYSLHHRSAIFEKSSAFGRIKGGSNYNTLYVQYHF